jgi:rubrerythrin
MDKEEFLKLVKIAIKMEKEAIDHYLKMADEASNPVMISVLRDVLAVAEMNHLHILEQLEQDLENGTCRIE